MKESQIEKKICEFAQDRGCLIYKFTSPGKRNVPDRIIVGPNGVVAFLEIKKPGGGIRSGQIRECRKLQGHGVPAAIVETIAAGELFIDAILNS